MCIACAKASLPEPVGPWMSTETFRNRRYAVGAACIPPCTRSSPARSSSVGVSCWAALYPGQGQRHAPERSIDTPTRSRCADAERFFQQRARISRRALQSTRRRSSTSGHSRRCPISHKARSSSGVASAMVSRAARHRHPFDQRQSIDRVVSCGGSSCKALLFACRPVRGPQPVPVAFAIRFPPRRITVLHQTCHGDG